MAQKHAWVERGEPLYPIYNAYQVRYVHQSLNLRGLINDLDRKVKPSALVSESDEKISTGFQPNLGPSAPIKSIMVINWMG